MREREKPRRRWKVNLQLQADSKHDLMMAMTQIVDSLSDVHLADVTHESVSGGCGSGWILSVDIDEAITEQSYREALGSYLDYLDSEPPDA